MAKIKKQQKNIPISFSLLGDESEILICFIKLCEPNSGKSASWWKRMIPNENDDEEKSINKKLSWDSIIVLEKKMKINPSKFLK